MNSIIGYINIRRDKSITDDMLQHVFMPVFGVIPVFVNENENIQTDNSYLGIVSKDCRHVSYLYQGRMVYAGKIVEWSKKPIRTKRDRIKEYKHITNEINKLLEERKKLTMKF